MSDASETPKGYFIDWDGKLRPIDQPGKGLRCEVDYKAKYVMVFNKYGGLDHESTWYPTEADVGGGLVDRCDRGDGAVVDHAGALGHGDAESAVDRLDATLDVVDRLIFAPRTEAARGGRSLSAIRVLDETPNTAGRRKK